MPCQHTTAVLRTILPGPLTHLSSFASLNKDFLAPHDTIHAVIKSGSDFHGILELTWASPTKSRPTSDKFVVIGTDGWLSINEFSVAGANAPVLRVTIKSVVKVEGKPEEETEEIIEEPMRGVQAELASFFDAINGESGVVGLGDPLAALRDVAIIQAGLNSGGEPVDLLKLVPATL